MAKETLAVYCPCQVYLVRLLRQINARNENLYEALGFTETASLKNHIQECRVKAVMFSRTEENLTEKERLQECLSEIVEKRIIVVMLGEQSDDYSYCSGLFGNEIADSFIYIDCYRSADVIVSELRQIMKTENSYIDQNLKNDYQLAGLYSPADKLSHPEMAAAIYKMYRGEKEIENAKALYINLEPFSGMSGVLDYKSEYNISDVIYTYRTNPGKLNEILRKACGRFGGMDVLLTAANCDDLKELGDGGWPDFLTAVARAGRFKMILIELFSFSDEMVMMMINNGNLYIPALPSYEMESSVVLLNDRNRRIEEEYKKAELRMMEFRKYFIDKGDEMLLDRIVELEV